MSYFGVPNRMFMLRMALLGIFFKSCILACFGVYLDQIMSLKIKKKNYFLYTLKNIF